MGNALVVGVGGFFGCIARYLIGVLIARLLESDSNEKNKLNSRRFQRNGDELRSRRALNTRRRLDGAANIG